MRSERRLWPVAAAMLLLVAAAAASAPGRSVTLIPGQSHWKYDTPGTNPAPDWPDGPSSENNWPSLGAPLGFGDSWISNAIPSGHMTYYFRKTFTLVDDPATITNLTLSANYDDGFVAYLNGAEITRQFMPTGTVTYSTQADDHESGSYERIDLTAHVGKLVLDRNVFAVEVHQCSGTSSDVCMDMALTCETTNPVPADAVVDWLWAGAVTTDGARMVARLLADSATARGLVSTNADLSSPAYSGYHTADSANDRTVSIAFTNLAPDTLYTYAVQADGITDAGKKGQFKTAPAGPASFSFAFSCGGRTACTGGVFEVIRDADPAFFLHTGDLYYENISENVQDHYRHVYATVLTSSKQAGLYRNTAVACMWDDHDFGPNDADSTSPGREAARLAYQQCVPHYPLVAGTGNVPIHQAFTYGRVRFILCDLRSERNPKTDPDDASKSMLGPDQKAWLKQELLDAKGRYPLIVWLSTVSWIASSGDDRWAGYTTERAELANFVKTNDIPPIVMLCGDAHMCAIDDGTNNDYASGGGPSFPVVQSGSLGQSGSVKGGPYTHGTYPGADQFSIMTVTDGGGTNLSVTVNCRSNYTVLATHTFDLNDAPAVSKPVIEPDGGTFTNSVSVALATLTPGASIFYTTDGEDPGTGSSLYSAPITLGSGVTTLKAKACLDGTGSLIEDALFNVATNAAATPEIAPGGGWFWESVWVTLATATPGASLFYTTDGGTPSTGSRPYASPFKLGTGTTEIKARAFLGGAGSGTAAATFDVRVPARTRLAILADTRGSSNEAYVNTNALNTIVEAILLLEPLPDAVLVAGDMIRTPDNVDGSYLQFTNAMAPLVEAGVPYYCAIGNHEVDHSLWYERWCAAFDFPTNGPAGWDELVYAVDVGCARILAVDAFTLGAGWQRDAELFPPSGFTCKVGQEQRDWLQSVAGPHSPAPFDIVLSHAVAYPISAVHRDTLLDCLDQHPADRDAFLQALSALKITANFTGHDHLYMRRMIDTRYSANFTYAVPHIGNISGASFHTTLVDTIVEPEVLIESVYTFTVVDLDPVSRTGTATAYADDGLTVLDVVMLTGKDAGPPASSVQAGSAWRYRKGTAEASDPPGAWRQLAFDDSSWSAGAAPFGYTSDTNEGPFGTTLDDMRYTYTSLFLRKAFTIESPHAVAEAVLFAEYDDGFIVWVNGEELVRVNVPGGPGSFLPYDATASTAIEPVPWARRLDSDALPPLGDGSNVLAVQAFNATLASSDLKFDLDLAFAEHSAIPGDHDGDGMQDDWETAFLAGTNAPLGEADTDRDGDGLSNIEEFIAGTHPTNPASRFDVQFALSSNAVTVSFEALAATGTGYSGYTRYYSLETRPALFQGATGSTGAWQTVAGYTHMPGAGQQVAYTNAAPDSTSLYRARVWLQR
ncbi:MAG: chitobiase/beta-hexosaminidase C-terminal domain-containing protein [Kiritimatiellae bacterium]|nr:chitobiase/beta-hexosaminidase C-terminal domain-containing protein [Kiritimatiellia bacterium]